MSDHDLIRRGDALYALHNGIGLGTAHPAYECIAALPADDRVAKLVEALRPFASLADEFGRFDRDEYETGLKEITVGDFRRARAAIAAWEAGK